MHRVNSALASAVAALAGAIPACRADEPPSIPPRVAAVPTRAAPPGGEPLEIWFTGSDDGYLDACGCDDGLLGGLPRRHTLLQILGGGRESVVLSNGRLIAGSEPLDEMKFEAILFAMAEMGYDAIALTDRELALGRETLAEWALNLGEECPFVATNLEDATPAGDGAPPLPHVRSCSIERGGASLLVIAAASQSLAPRYAAADAHARLAEPVRALHEEIAAHGDGANVVVLAQMSIEEATRLAEALPRIELLIVQGPDAEDHPRDEAVRVGETDIVTTGRKGKFLGGYRFGDGAAAGEYRREPIEDSLHKSSDVQGILELLYRDRLLDEKPIERYFERRPTASGTLYAGAEEGSCASCHPKAWETWARSGHARAWQTLVDQDLPPDPADKKGRLKNAIWDPDCVRCHVTGFGEVSGYAGLDRERPDARLVDVTCEACHGPSGDHALRAMEGDTAYPGGKAPRMPTATQILDRAEMDAAERYCMRCHDPDNSPNFLLREYWKGIVRGEQREPIEHGPEGD